MSSKSKCVCVCVFVCVSARARVCVAVSPSVGQCGWAGYANFKQYRYSWQNSHRIQTRTLSTLGILASSKSKHLFGADKRQRKKVGVGFCLRHIWRVAGLAWLGCVSMLMEQRRSGCLSTRSFFLKLDWRRSDYISFSIFNCIRQYFYYFSLSEVLKGLPRGGWLVRLAS